MTSNDSHHQDFDWPQVARYLSGELTPGEAQALKRWLERDERSRQLLAEARAAWTASASLRGEWDADAGLQRLRQAVAATAAPPARPRRVLTFAWPERRLAPTALAASLAALAVAGVALWSLLRSNTMIEHPAPVAITEVTTQRGQRADVLLPDGSRITLGVASRLRYPRDFGVDARTVQLDGEAYFEVVHDAARPFRVRAGAGELEDVGTAFVVHAYGRTDVRVVVTEGSVVVRRSTAPRNSVVLTAGQLAQVGGHGIVRQTDVRVDGYVAWMHGELVFDDATLATVADELSRWYDVDVRTADSTIAALRFTGSFRRQSIDSVVGAIAAATNVAVERTAGGWRFR